MTPAQKKAEAARVARLAIGRTTIPGGKTVERATVNDYGQIVITFAGTGLAPFREARYTPKEVLDMIGEPR
jgi:hypothetical protein